MKADFRHIGIDTLTDFAQQNKDMSLGDILYSSLRNTMTTLDKMSIEDKQRKDRKPNDPVIECIQGLHNLRYLTDEQIYSAIEKAMKDEREE